MNTFWKVLLCVVAVLLALKFLPVLVVAVVIGAVITLLVAGALVGGLGAVFFTLLVSGLAIVAVLSPIWIPVLAVVGVCALIRRSTSVKA